MELDVREPSEYAAGFIPTARNIPISSNPDALFLPPDEFEERFGFIKPPMGKEVVFYCKAGVRSSAAASMALQYVETPFLSSVCAVMEGIEREREEMR